MADWYAPIARHFNFPVSLCLSGRKRFYKHYRALERVQWYSSEAIARIQWGRLGKLLTHAFMHSPYWQRVSERLNIAASDISSLNDFKKLPITTKIDLQKNLSSMMSVGIGRKKLIKNASGGSTGEPTIFYQDIERNFRRAMDQIRHDRWSGWEIGEKIALLWGANYELKKLERIGERLKNALFFRYIHLDAFDLTEEKMYAYLQLLKKRRPTIIIAYAQAITLFAQYIKERNCDIRPLSLRGIISSAEKLYPWQRQLIEEVFGCKVFDRYGSREVGLVASECDRFEGMHANSDNVLVEFVRDDGAPCRANEPGRIIVTDLWNFVTPFIRYDTGDIGIPLSNHCSCGRGLPLMKCVEGRTADFICLPGGKKIHGEYFTHLFYGVRGVKQFQLVQTLSDELMLKIVKTSEFNQENMDIILKKTKDFINNPQIKIVVRYVDKIPLLPSGKRRFVVSRR